MRNIGWLLIAGMALFAFSFVPAGPASAWCEADCTGLCQSLAAKGIGSATECIQQHKCSNFANGKCEPDRQAERLKSILSQSTARQPSPGKCNEQPGFITCQEFCRKRRPRGYYENCLRDDPKSCMALYGNLTTCVRDVCDAGRITCKAWCAKYRDKIQQENCLRNSPGSCLKKYGSYDVCVGDGPA
jgi:hypothetical protein